MTKPKPAVFTQPESRDLLKGGFDKLARLLAVTLGPSKGMVLNTAELKSLPESLNNAATIARRVIALPDRGEDMGAMLLRHLVWRVHQRVGDGGATAAVLARAILNQATRNVTAGANPIRVAKGIERGVQVAINELDKMAQSPEDEDDLVAVANAVTGEPDLSLVLGEMYDILGANAYITIEDYVAPYLERTYIDGGRWDARLGSPYLMTSPATKQAILKDPQVALFGGDVTQADQVRPLLEIVAKSKPAHLLLVCYKISGDGLNSVVATHTQTDLNIIAVGIHKGARDTHIEMEDLAALSGAQLLAPELGRPLRLITQDDLGRANRVEATPDALFLVGGGGDAGEVRNKIELIQRQLEDVTFDSPDRAELQRRLSRMSGSAAILKIGAHTKTERSILHQKAEQGTKALTATMECGYLPGGGTAYLHCIKAIVKLGAPESDDEGMGRRAVMFALEAPFRQILFNARIDAASVFLDQVLQGEPGNVYDVVRRKILPARQAGVLDSAKVLRIALESASSGAMMALSTDILVLRRRPEESLEP
jgi:chaperonin GroEL